MTGRPASSGTVCISSTRTVCRPPPLMSVPRAWSTSAATSEGSGATDSMTSSARTVSALPSARASAHRHSSQRCDQPGVGEFTMTAGGEFGVTVDRATKDAVADYIEGNYNPY